MPILQAEIITQLELLRARTLSDFAAVASRQEADRVIRWTCGSGNGNERFLQMKETIGSGMAGWVMRHGRPFVVRSTEPGAEMMRRSYPIMLAENLYAAAAVPVPGGTDICMALLIGRRTVRDYSAADMQILEQVAAQCSDICCRNDRLAFRTL